MTFAYQPIDKQGLRLLEPVSRNQDYLTFRMHSFSSHIPSYTAISYTWGDEAPIQTIYIDGQRFPVRTNLWSCLYYIGGDRNVPWRYIWVDAICIDQSNVKERSAQVARMDEIYRDATQVSAWLGLPTIPDHCKHYEGLYGPIKTLECGFDWFLAMEDLANRPYWNRRWVIQEVLLGSTVYLYCGDAKMECDDFKDMLGRETGSAGYVLEDFDYSRVQSGTWAAWPLLSGRHPYKHPKMRLSLHKLILNHARSQCKDPRDRIFALLGLVHHEEAASLRGTLPDYTMSEDDVMVHALSHIQAEEGGLLGTEWDTLLSALGIEDSKTRRKLLRSADVYGCGGDSALTHQPLDNEVRRHGYSGDHNFEDGVDGGSSIHWIKRTVMVMLAIAVISLLDC